MERRRKSMSISRNGRSPEEIELTQNIEIDGVPFEVNVKLCRAGLSIRADNPKERELKVIEVDEE